MSSSAELTLRQETELEPEDVKRLADHVCAPGEIGAKPASGSFKTEGMLIVTTGGEELSEGQSVIPVDEQGERYE